MATYFWVGGSGTWDNASTANWATSSGGPAGFGPPNNADTVNFDANSGTAATVTVAATATCLNGTINKADINLSLSGSPTLAGALTLTTGTITLNSFTLTALRFVSAGTATRTVSFGTGKISLTGNNATVLDVQNTGFTATGSRVVDLTYAGATGTRTLRWGYQVQYAESSAVSVNVLGGTDTVAFATDGSSTANNINFTGFAGTFNFGFQCYIWGNLTLASGTTPTANTNALVFVGTGSQTITSNGASTNCPITFNGVGGTWTLQDNFTMSSGRAFTLTNGTFDANTKNVTIGSLALGSGTKTLTLSSGTWTCLAGWNANTNVTNLTVSASTGTISMTSASAKTFSGGAKVWPTLNQGGAGNLTIAQSNTFANITDTVQPATVRLTAGTTQTVSALSLAGTSGNLITLDTTVAGTRATIFKASGSVSLSFVSIKDIAATGGANFNAFTSNGCVDGGNNTGWDFNSVLYPTIYTVRKTKRYFLN